MIMGITARIVVKVVSQGYYQVKIALVKKF